MPAALYCRYIAIFALLFLRPGSGDLAAQSYDMPFNSTLEISAGSGFVYDNGGSEGDYQINSHDVLVIRPDVDGKFIRLAFTSFELENCCDSLFIFGGPSTSSYLIGRYHESPDTIISGDPGGAITLLFVSYGPVAGSGFIADISLLDSIPESDITFISTEVFPDSIVAGANIICSSEIRNLGPAAVNNFHIEYHLSTDTVFDGSDQILFSRGIPLLAPGTSFVKEDQEIQIPAITPEGEYYIIKRIIDEEGFFDRWPKNSISVIPLKINALEVDISIPEIGTIPSVITQGMTHQLTYWIKNEGNISLPSINVGVYLSHDLILDEGDIKISEKIVADISLQDNRMISYFIEQFYDESLIEGVYYLLIVADNDDQFPETDESNNVFATQVLFCINTETSGKNLKMSSIKSRFDTLTNRNDMNLSFKINSNLNAVTSDLRVILSSDTIVDPDEDGFIDHFDLWNLETGENEIVKKYFFDVNMFPGIELGLNYIIGEIDPYSEKGESDYTDNKIFIPIYITDSFHYDLEIIEFTANRDFVLKDKSFLAECTLTNSGSHSVNAPGLGFFLSTDLVYDSSDILVGLGSPSHLYPGLAISNRVNILLDKYTPGDYYIIAVADPDSIFDEVNESNNYSTWPIKLIDESSIERYDIEIKQLCVSDTIGIGEYNSFEFECFFHNTQSESVGFGVYLSADSIFDLEDLPNKLKSFSSTIEPYMNMKIEWNFDSPEDIEEGKYFIIVKADYENLYFEDDESNNLIIKPLSIISNPVKNELIISDLKLQELVLGQLSELSGSFSYRQNGPGLVDSVLVEAFIVERGAAVSGLSVWSDTLFNLLTYSRSGDFEFSLPDTMVNGLYELAVRISPMGILHFNSTSTNQQKVLFALQETDEDYVLHDVLLKDAVLYESERLEFTYWVSNMGTTLSAALDICYFLSSDETFSPDDIKIGEYQLKGLGIQKPKSLSQYVDLPPSISGGSYFLFIIIDPEAKIVESSVSNNSWSTQIEVLHNGINLIIEELQLNTTTPVTGSSLHIDVTVRNTGNLRAYSNYLGFYLSKDTIQDDSDLLFSSNRFSSIYSGTVVSSSSQFQLNSSLDKGLYYIIVKADHRETISEIMEEDNIEYLAFEIVASQIDFELLGAKLSDTLKLTPSSNSQIALNVKNNGIHECNHSIRISHYLSADSTLSLLDDTWLGHEPSYINLSPGEVGEVSVALDLPSSIPLGKYYWIIILDSEDDVEETNEDNNFCVIPVELVEPDFDLVISTLEVSADTTSLGAEVLGHFVVINRGQTSTGLVSSCRLFLSADTIADSNDYLVSSQNIPSLFGSETFETTHDFIIPNSLEAGPYFLICVADYDNKLGENDEENNARFVSLYIEPAAIDLRTTNLSVSPGQASSGDRIRLDCLVENTGSSPTNSSSNLGYYFSVDSILDASDLLVGTDYIGILYPNAYGSESTTFYLPAVGIGQYYILFVVDSEDNISEINEENNVSSVPIVVSGSAPMPDYTITSYEANWMDDYLLIQFTVTNTGTANGRSNLEWALVYSSDSVYDEGEESIRNLSFMPIDINESKTMAFEITQEQYKASNVLVVLDQNNKIAELNEDNNWALIEMLNQPFDIECDVLSMVDEAYPGDTVHIEYTLINNSKNTSDSIEVYYYLSVDEYFNDEDRILFAESVGFLYAGERKTIQQQLLIPSDISEGNYALIVVANKEGLEAETNADNNEDIIYYLIKGSTLNNSMNSEISGIRIFPNPVSDILNVESKSMLSKYLIVNSSGAVVKSGELNSQLQGIQVRELVPGSYYLHIESDSFLEVIKFQIVH